MVKHESKGSELGWYNIVIAGMPTITPNRIQIIDFRELVIFIIF